MQPEFAAYQKRVVANARAMRRRWWRPVSGGVGPARIRTWCCWMSSPGTARKESEQALDRARITVNKKHSIRHQSSDESERDPFGFAAVTIAGSGRRRCAR